LLLNPKTSNLKPHLVYPERSRGGFTLVEVMVSIVIVGGILGMSVMIFETAKNKKTAETIAREVADKLAEAHADAMIPPYDKNDLAKVNVSCIDSDRKLVQKYLKSDETPIGDEILLYKFPSRVTFSCPSSPIEFEAKSGITLGKIVSTDEPKISITKNFDTYEAKIDTMSGAVNVEKQ